MKPAPRDYIESFIGGSDYWANGIRKEYRTTNPDQMAFVETFKTLLVELMSYVKEYHTTGLTWNPKGVDISEYNPDNAVSAPVSKSVNATPVVTSAAKPSSSPAPTVNLFAALNKGENITTGLKTVTKDMQTWRQEYKGGSAPAPTATVTSKVQPRVTESVKGPAKLEYQSAGSKWVVENQSSAATVTIADKKETVYIFGCIGASIEVVGKCKSIVVDSC